MNGDNQLRDILHHLRPRTAEPTLFSQAVWYLLWIGIAVLLALYIMRWIHHRRQRLAEFQDAAKAAGLTGSQTAFLHQIARKRRMKSPPRLLSSPQVFDRQVGAYADAITARQAQHPELAAISQIRTALGFDTLDLDQSLSSTRQIDRGQTVMIGTHADSDAEEALFPWLVLERDEATLTLAPVLREAGRPEQELRPEAEITARFWREGDTEYTFATTVIRRSRTEHSIAVRHTSVEREQNRGFYRIDVDFSADFLLLALNHEPEAGIAGIQSDAAIKLLDQTEARGIRVDTTRVEVDPASARASEQARLAAAPRVHAHVVNLSAGGLAIDLAPGQSGANEDLAWMVDPAFDGPFPLAGLTCVPLSSEPSPGGGRRIKMRFEALPIVAEKEIVRGVYEHQLNTAGGRRPAPAIDKADAGSADDAEEDLFG
ncbi:MAG: hypothetical protein O2782_23405, partial [bacterium]|nr:hypothetical protein [bacterium]